MPPIDRRPARTLLVSKIFYFFYWGAMASLGPFLALYYEGLGLSGRQIGLLTGLSPLVMLLASPLWGGLADATQQHGRLLRLAIGGSLAMVAILSGTGSFFWLIPVVVAYAFFMAPVMPLVDNTVMELLADRKNEYGKQRLWGAIGWGLVAPLAGFLIQRSGLAWAFYGYFLLMAGSLLVSWRLSISHAGLGNHFWSGLRRLLADRAWLLFLATALVGGMGLGVIYNFLFLHLNALGASKTLMGLSLTSATASEATVMFFSDALLRRWGARGLLIFSLLALGVRLAAYSFMAAPWPVLAIQLLHGPTFAAMWVAAVSYAAETAPPGMGATAQGILAGVMWGLGIALGSLAGGLLYDSLGPALMFRWASGSMLLGLLFLALTPRRAETPAPLKL